MNGFKRDIAAVINRHSRENKSNTPDFLLAEIMVKALSAYEKTVMQTALWHMEAQDMAKNVLADTEDTGEKCPKCGLNDIYQRGNICPQCGFIEKTQYDIAGVSRLPPKEQDDEEMDLHGEIMNLRIKLGKQIIAINEATEPPILSLGDIAIRAYKRGHRDARHGAAELACEWQASKGDN